MIVIVILGLVYVGIMSVWVLEALLCSVGVADAADVMVV